jgi:hypothetical protein
VRWNRVSDAKIDLKKPSGTTTNVDGRYELTIWIEKDKTLNVREVFAELDGYVLGESPADFPLRGGDTAKVDFQLSKGELLAGTIRLPLLPAEQRLPKATQETVAKRMFTVTGPNLQTRTLNARLRLTDANGSFKTYLPAGDYALEVLNYSSETPKWSGVKTGQGDLILELTAFEWSEAEVGRVFDELWSAMDRSYSYFALKNDVDWPAVKKKHRSRAAACKNTAELSLVLQEMLAPLRDLHIWIETPSGILGTHQSGATYNGNRQITLGQIDDRVVCGKFAVVGRTKPDGFGYFLMVQQSAANAADVKQAVEAIQNLRDAPGFIVDLRNANGGNEVLAQEIARVFCGQETIYAKHKYRSGPGHADFGPEQQRVLSASPNPFTKPIVCLTGPGAASSGEGFVKMLRSLPHVTTVGLPTRGASGNPHPHQLSRTGLSVYFSRWVDLMPDGTTFEGRGIPPAVEVNQPASAYREADPTLDKGLETLRSQIAKNKAVP